MVGKMFILWSVYWRQINRGLMQALTMAMAWHSLKLDWSMRIIGMSMIIARVNKMIFKRRRSEILV